MPNYAKTCLKRFYRARSVLNHTHFSSLAHLVYRLAQTRHWHVSTKAAHLLDLLNVHPYCSLFSVITSSDFSVISSSDFSVLEKQSVHDLSVNWVLLPDRNHNNGCVPDYSIKRKQRRTKVLCPGRNSRIRATTSVIMAYIDSCIDASINCKLRYYPIVYVAKNMKLYDK